MAAVSALPPSQLQSRPIEFDSAIIDDCRLGNPLAIQSFVQHHQRMVFAFLARLLGPQAAIEDIAQEVFGRALRALPRFDTSGPARVSPSLRGGLWTKCGEHPVVPSPTHAQTSQ